MEKFMTKEFVFGELLAFIKEDEIETEHLTTENLVEFLEKELATAIKAKEKRATAKSKKNDEVDAPIKSAIMVALADGSKKTMTEVYNAVSKEFDTITTQKVTAMLSKLCAEGALERVVKSGKPIYGTPVETEGDAE